MNYGIAYMGSKNRFVDLIDYMLQRHYDKKYFIDLFCGGFAVSHYVLLNSNHTVIANDINKYTTGLIKQAIAGLPDSVYKFIDRDEFFEVIKNPDNYPEWYVGYVTQNWSFGNSGTSYLYAKEKVKEKQLLHNAIVFNQWDDEIKELEKIVPNYIKNLDYKKYPMKRIALMSYVQNHINERYQMDELGRLERLQQLEGITYKIGNSHLKEITTLDWTECIKGLSVEILKNAIIYCDPPYEDTQGYVVGGIEDYDVFWDWVHSSPYCIYVSSYKAPKGIKLIKNINVKNTFASMSGNDASENLYWNGKGKPNNTLEDFLFNSDLFINENDKGVTKNEKH